MADESGLSEFFVNQEVGIAFALLLIFPALAYFAITAPSYLSGTEGGVFSWVITVVVLYLEAVIVAAFYRTTFRE